MSMLASYLGQVAPHLARKAPRTAKPPHHSLLTVALDQITRPSFLPTYDAPTRRPAKRIAEEKRQQVLDCIRAAGKSVSATWVMDYTGYTKQSVMHLLYKLQDEGLITRKESPGDKIPGTTFILWEAVPGKENGGAA